jgi:hypothetical protein
MRRIACSGIYRSGSTWLFNVCRLSCPNDEVIKLHPPDDGDFDVVLTSHRDLRKIAASLWRMYGGRMYGDSPAYTWDHTWNELSECVRFHEFWRIHPKMVLDMKFEKFSQNKIEMFDLVREAIGATTDRDSVWNELQCLVLPNRAINVDPTTNLHWNHITSSNPESLFPLTEMEVRSVQDRFKEWQESMGYVS